MGTLEQFMSRTEDNTAGLAVKQTTVELKYPLTYIETVTNVELRLWSSSGVLHNLPKGDTDFPLYWKRGEDWKFLGYITFGFSTFQKLSYLVDRNLKFMRDPDHEELVRDRIAVLFLLGG